MAKELKKHYSARELSAFCLQISLLLRAAIPLDEGLSVMAEERKRFCCTCLKKWSWGVRFRLFCRKWEVIPPM